MRSRGRECRSKTVGGDKSFAHLFSNTEEERKKTNTENTGIRGKKTAKTQTTKTTQNTKKETKRKAQLQKINGRGGLLETYFAHAAAHGVWGRSEDARRGGKKLRDIIKLDSKYGTAESGVD